jgi:hypothetical protein
VGSDSPCLLQKACTPRSVHVRHASMERREDDMSDEVTIVMSCMTFES